MERSESKGEERKSKVNKTTKKKSNFKGWGNVFNVLVKKPAQRVAKRAKTRTVKELKKAIGLPTKKGKKR